MTSTSHLGEGENVARLRQTNKRTSMNRRAPGRDVIGYRKLECDNWMEHPFGVLLNKSLYCMFPDPFLPRVAVKGSGYARLGEVKK